MSITRRKNRLKVLSDCPNCPKYWQDMFVLIRNILGIRPWWVRGDGRPLFRQSWGLPRHGLFVCDWEDLTRAERIAALKLVASSVYEPVGLDPPF